MNDVPATRLREIHRAPVCSDGEFVLYWMTANRRVRWNFALQQAVAWCRELKRPLVVLETLEAEQRWSTTRHHRFVLQGMQVNARRLRDTPALYYPYLAARSSQVEQLLAVLARRACLVVCDDTPIHERDLAPADACADLPVRVEAVDSIGLLPLHLADRAYPSAYTMRRFLHRRLPDHLMKTPKANPLTRVRLPAAAPLPISIVQRWRPINELLLGQEPRLPRRGAIDGSIEPVDTVGGNQAAEGVLRRFIRSRLASYAKERNHPDEDATSGLAPYLHFGHISPHQIFDGIARHEGWSPDQLGQRADGQREGWWGMSESAEAFLDQLVTWRELGYNFCVHRQDYHHYDSLPEWSRATLGKHARDRREYVYPLKQFEQAATHDPLWNAAQMQLVREGRIHNYLRMLWGKKILEWSASPREALAVMIDLNNRYALDGCDPNSYSGIFWILGRYDRPFGPERPVFGKIRYMSSQNTARKLRLQRFLKRTANSPSDPN
ncbi:MAG: deoxyribodipyrimidine photolyase [Pirellulales bacterium]|nr:deoxyribodipyrimidine photolyase [Pirellulales bacterium]